MRIMNLRSQKHAQGGTEEMSRISLVNRTVAAPNRRT
jgi:hypothetical protein